MSKELIEALNRLSAAIEKTNDEEIQRRLARVKIEELSNALEDKVLMKKVTEALSDHLPPPHMPPHMPMADIFRLGIEKANDLPSIGL